MYRIKALFSLILMLCLTACMTAGSLKTEDLHGLWKNEAGQFFLLDERGSLVLLRNAETAGLSWNFDGKVLTLETQRSPDSEPEKQSLYLQKCGLFSLEFLDDGGKPVVWSRSFRKVEVLEGSLFYRERMMLPPDVLVSVQLRNLEGEMAGSSLVHADGREELSFAVHYFREDLDTAARLDAAVFYGEEPLFVTNESVTVELDGRPSVLLHHAVPSQKEEIPLQGTYWRLKVLDGKPSENFADQPEAHLILLEKGEAAGSDGCNNFFMSWEISDERIVFTPGGATLRLCPKGEEQARRMLQMFPRVNGWKISDGKLELSSEDSVEAVFEAVEM